MAADKHCMKSLKFLPKWNLNGLSCDFRMTLWFSPCTFSTAGTFFFFFFFCFLGPHKKQKKTCGSSQARSQNGAAAACLPHSSQCQILHPLSKARDQTHTLLVLVGFVYPAPPWELPVGTLLSHILRERKECVYYIIVLDSF